MQDCAPRKARKAEKPKTAWKKRNSTEQTGQSTGQNRISNERTKKKKSTDPNSFLGLAVDAVHASVFGGLMVISHTFTRLHGLSGRCRTFPMCRWTLYPEVDSSSSWGQSVDLRRERACSRLVGDT